MKRVTAIISIHCTPAILFLVYTALMGDFYYTPVYRLTGGVFLCVSAGIAVYNSRGMMEFLQRSVSVLFFSMLFSWFVALGVLGLLNLTPLCIGQDNGDGINSFQQCAMYTILNGFVYTVAMLVVIATVALFGGLMLQRMADREEGEAERVKGAESIS